MSPNGYVTKQDLIELLQALESRIDETLEAQRVWFQGALQASEKRFDEKLDASEKRMREVVEKAISDSETRQGARLIQTEIRILFAFEHHEADINRRLDALESRVRALEAERK